MQNFKFKTQYDAIWIQWVLCYLTDDDICEFLQKTKKDGLSRDKNGKAGLIFIKENTSDHRQFLLDTEQNAVWRNRSQFRAIFEDAGFKVLREDQQRGNQVQKASIMSITCYVLQPIYENEERLGSIAVKVN